ncbi:MAG: hypothetical protein HOE30_11705 [Deltaproteobacteria bacterium]|jgi:hypothetical protein|nr:hypothetical protein [Deltaproteobacteria bacterium]MBT4641589.1 hypothetical protein [Deltaproteobacteria bacterium]
MKKSTIFLMGFVFLTMTICGNQAQAESKWYDYGNGIINLANVTHFGWGTQGTYKNDSGEDVTDTCQSILQLFENAKLDKAQRADLNIYCNAYIKFDLFTLTVDSRILTTKSDLELSEKQLKISLEQLRQFLKGSNRYL